MGKEEPLFIFGIYWLEPRLSVIESIILEAELSTLNGGIPLLFTTF